MPAIVVLCCVSAVVLTAVVGLIGLLHHKLKGLGTDKPLHKRIWNALGRS